jgi:hypothetical protein
LSLIRRSIFVIATNIAEGRRKMIDKEKFYTILAQGKVEEVKRT